MTVWSNLAPSKVTDGLRAQLVSDEPAHSWLLLGPQGSGKSAAARAIAAALNCTVSPGEGCGTCSTCLRIARRRHPDVHHVIPEGPLIPVDVIRETVIPEATRSAFEGRRRVFIIEEADRMSPPAQNALLKTLEEPTEHTVFVLVSDKEDDVLETIHSRCRIVRMEPVPETRVIELLQDEGVTPERARLAARLAEGDYERARTIALDPDAEDRRQLWLSIPRRLVGPSDALDAAVEVLAEARDAVKDRESQQKQEVKDLAEAMGEGRGTASARNALAKRHKRELRRVEEEVLADAFASLGSFFRDVLAVRSGGAEAVTNVDMLEELDLWAGSPIPDVNLVSVMQRCVEARASLTWNANQQLATEAVLIEVSRLAPASARVGVRT